MAEKNKDKLKELTNLLDQGIKEVFEKENFEKFLQVMSRFHRYSFRNVVLIWKQNPNATQVAEFGRWKDTYKRYVKKGERSIQIFAPAEREITRLVPKLDEQTKLQVVDGNGQNVMVNQKFTVKSYAVSNVFDLLQTEGEDLPSRKETLIKLDDEDKVKKVLQTLSPIPLKYEKLGEKRGCYDEKTNTIVINEEQELEQLCLAALHEITYIKLLSLQEEMEAEPKVRTFEEACIVYVIGQKLGIQEKSVDYEYISTWAQGQTLETLKETLKTISKTTNEIIRGIEKQFEEYLGKNEKSQKTWKPASYTR